MRRDNPASSLICNELRPTGERSQMNLTRGVRLVNLLVTRSSGRIRCPWVQYQPACSMGSRSDTPPALSQDTAHQGVLQELRVPFSRATIGTFFQEQPRLGNQFLEDALLQGYLKRHLPPQVLEEVSRDFERFGCRLVDEIDSLGRECELNPPQLQHYDAWGHRVDRIVTCPAWKKMKELSAEEGLVAEAYERRYSRWSRMVQVVKLYLYAPSSGFYSCPLAMTDGAAKVIESLGVPTPLQDAFKHLTTRNPSSFWTSGQWMTERRGGSDVAGGTETVAQSQADGTYKLHGFKWFTSATDSDMSLTLGRVTDTQGHTVQGTRGLSLFYLKVRDPDGRLNGIEIQRLKDKLGTRQLPTAELLLDGVKALRVGVDYTDIALQAVAGSSQQRADFTRGPWRGFYHQHADHHPHSQHHLGSSQHEKGDQSGEGVCHQKVCIWEADQGSPTAHPDHGTHGGKFHSHRTYAHSQ
ncbi:hypothetical protein FKM82_029140 [Ascaphus truei]